MANVIIDKQDQLERIEAELLPGEEFQAVFLLTRSIPREINCSQDPRKDLRLCLILGSRRESSLG
jgi:hypothetical protein